jgi:ubiquinone/menaquinone biosynthesis C-methylase UbiE
MEAKVHRRVQRYGWDKAVGDYDRYFVPLIKHCSERVISMLDLKPGERVLDIAAGTGVGAFMASDRIGPAGELVATDISEKMVEATRAEAEERGVSNMRFGRMDAEELDFSDGSFDAVMCILGLMYPADPQTAIAEMYRVLRHGGRAAAAVWGRRDRCGWNAVFPITDARVNSDVCPLFFQLGAPNALKKAFEKAGFAVEDEQRIDKSVDFASESDMLSAIFAGGPVALAYSRFSSEVRDEVHREFVESVSSYRRGAGYDVPGEFVFVLGRKE